MTTTPDPHIDPLALGQQIIEILETGKKTSTYKLATLHALIDCCIERVPDEPAASIDVPLDDLTAKVIDLYWPQTRALKWIDGGRPLRQSGQATTILDAIGDFRTDTHAGKNTLLDDAKLRAPQKYAETFKKVKRTLVRYPLVLLQTLPGDSNTFLYDDTWMKEATFATIDQPNNMIQLRPGVANAMARLAGLLRPTLEYVWVDKVWKSNHEFFQDGLDVKQYLFGEDRVPLTRVGSALKENFGPKCFYCNVTQQQVSRFHIDHVLPLSITSINGLANLVLACQPCNSDKSDHLPAIQHVERALGLSPSAETPNRDKGTLDKIGHAIHWDAQYDRVKNAARGVFKTTPPHTPTWRAIASFDRLPSKLPAWVTAYLQENECGAIGAQPTCCQRSLRPVRYCTRQVWREG